MPEPGCVLSRQEVEATRERAEGGWLLTPEEAQALARSHEQLRKALEKIGCLDEDGCDASPIASEGDWPPCLRCAALYAGEEKQNA